jgi:sortase A
MSEERMTDGGTGALGPSVDVLAESGPPTETSGRHKRPTRHRAPMTFGDKVRFGLRGIGQTLITAGLVVLLFVVYEVYITNLFSHRLQHRVHTALEQEWANGQDPLALPGGNQSAIPLGQGIANIYIPRFGRDYAFTIVQGTSESDLEKGPGHYVGTALPGQLGNFAMAGHRVGKGEPFLNLDHLKPGDAVIIETKAEWYVYRVLGDVPRLSFTEPNGKPWVDSRGVPGREIVDPSDGRVILPVPNQPNAPQSSYGYYLTMTTCHPKFTATQRMIVHAVLDKSRDVPRTGDVMPASIQALYSEGGL